MAKHGRNCGKQWQFTARAFVPARSWRISKMDQGAALVGAKKSYDPYTRPS
jgi:hypothetical protein